MRDFPEAKPNFVAIGRHAGFEPANLHDTAGGVLEHIFAAFEQAVRLRGFGHRRHVCPFPL
jgi:hypothetical protein